jgi:hypothetical protein
MAHPQEMIIGEKSTGVIDKMYPGLLDTLNTDPLRAFRNLWIDYLSSMSQLDATKERSNYNSVGDINVMVSVDGGQNDPQDIARAVSSELEREFTGRGIQFSQL